MTLPRKLIEVLLSLEAMNAPCARETSIRHAHITLQQLASEEMPWTFSAYVSACAERPLPARIYVEPLAADV